MVTGNSHQQAAQASRPDQHEIIARGLYRLRARRPLHDAGETARKFFINERVDWMAVYEPQSGQFAVCRLLQAPEAGGHISTI